MDNNDYNVMYKREIGGGETHAWGLSPMAMSHCKLYTPFNYNIMVSYACSVEKMGQ